MTRLPSELHRLFVPQGPGPARQDLGASDLIDGEGRVRAMVLGLARPADWQALSKVWQGVQADLGLPAPAIAVAGPQGHQLWFSVSDPVPAPQAMDFLDGLRRRYLADTEAQRIGLLPQPDANLMHGIRHAVPTPAPLEADGPWSAFVAADLAPMFSEEPWLDMPPNPEGQADLLARLASIPQADFLRALDQLAPVTLDAMAASANEQASPPAPRSATADPRRFLVEVMNDERVPLALRIDAAKALLASSDHRTDGER